MSFSTTAFCFGCSHKMEAPKWPCDNCGIPQIALLRHGTHNVAFYVCGTNVCKRFGQYRKPPEQIICLLSDDSM